MSWTKVSTWGVGIGRFSALAGMLVGRIRCGAALVIGTPVERFAVGFFRLKGTSSRRRRLPLGRRSVLVRSMRSFVNGKSLSFSGDGQLRL